MEPSLEYPLIQDVKLTKTDREIFAKKTHGERLEFIKPIEEAKQDILVQIGSILYKYKHADPPKKINTDLTYQLDNLYAQHANLETIYNIYWKIHLEQMYQGGILTYFGNVIKGGKKRKTKRKEKKTTKNITKNRTKTKKGF